MILRDYQQRTVGAVREAWLTHRRVCVVAPTGAGKTAIGAALCGERTLWLAHRVELVAQARARLPDGVRVETVQGLLASGERPAADLVVTDECHHHVAQEWRTVVDHYSRALHLGLTATPQRPDGAPLGDIYDHLVVAAHYSELITAGHLVSCEAYAPASDVTGGLAMDPVDAYLKLGDNKRCFLFTGRVGAAEEYASRLVAAGVPAAAVSAETDDDVRARALEQFRAGVVRVLCNVFLYTEGTDVPEAEVCLFARGCGHVSTYLQMAGRVLRPSSGKDHATLIDLCGVVEDYGLPTIDRTYSLHGQAISTRQEALHQCRACGYCWEGGDRACPKCSFEPEEKFKAPKIYSVELKRVFAGQSTPDEAKVREWARLKRLCAAKGWSLSWAASKYRALFNEPPTLTHDERMLIFDQLLKRAAEKGYKRGWAYHMLKRATA